MRMDNSALKRAIDKSGGQTALATAIGKQQGHISAWLRRGNVPAEHCPAIEAATGVPCEELRPDVAWHVLRGKSAAEIAETDSATADQQKAA